MTKQDAVEAAMNKAVTLTQGTVICVNAERFDALRKAGLLEELDDSQGWMTWGIESDNGDDMVYCMIK